VAAQASVVRGGLKPWLEQLACNAVRAALRDLLHKTALAALAKSSERLPRRRQGRPQTMAGAARLSGSKSLRIVGTPRSQTTRRLNYFDVEILTARAFGNHRKDPTVSGGVKLHRIGGYNCTLGRSAIAGA
jgi:hypothetical protein